jgi:hypothetical protein
MKAVEGVASMARSVGSILIVQCSDRKIESKGPSVCVRRMCLSAIRGGGGRK